MRETSRAGPSKGTHADSVLFEPAAPDEGGRVLACSYRRVANIAADGDRSSRGPHWGGPGGPLREMQDKIRGRVAIAAVVELPHLY